MAFERGLKEVSKGIARTLGVPQGAIYTEQQKLMAAGILEKRKGKGPGSGVECSAETLAVLLSSFFANCPAKDIAAMAEHARRLAVRDWA